jgi:IS605 OrfB family transposase
VAKTVETKWNKDRFEVLIRNVKRPPHFRDTLPIPVRRQELKLTRIETGLYELSFPLKEGRGQSIRLPLKVHDAYQRRLLEGFARYTDGDLPTTSSYKMRAAKLIRDDRGRWYVTLAYTSWQPKSVEKGWAAINRGIRCFLAGVLGDQPATWMYDGSDIVAHLKQMQRRRREYQRSIRAAHRQGHGRKRSLAPIEVLREKVDRWRAAKCQVIAVRFAEWCRENNVGTVALEELSGIRDFSHDRMGEHVGQLIQEWPFYQMQQRLECELEERGIRIVKVPAAYISQVCPKCGHCAEENKDLRWWKLRCVSCKHEQHLDQAAARNVLYRAWIAENLPVPEAIKTALETNTVDEDGKVRKIVRQSRGSRSARGKRGK